GVHKDSLRPMRDEFSHRRIPAALGEIAKDDQVFIEGSGYTAMTELITHRPEAVFVHSDSMALGASRALRDAGLTVPDDMALVGFDDLSPAMQSEVSMTTVRQPVERTGQLAVETLVDRLQHPNKATTHRILSVELVVRSSCGAIR
ncbi:MAG: substrate-binding domain-containing protein, partial [Pseudomonadota bacterium]